MSEEVKERSVCNHIKMTISHQFNHIKKIKKEVNLLKYIMIL